MSLPKQSSSLPENITSSTQDDNAVETSAAADARSKNPKTLKEQAAEGDESKVGGVDLSAQSRASEESQGLPETPGKDKSRPRAVQIRRSTKDRLYMPDDGTPVDASVANPIKSKGAEKQPVETTTEIAEIQRRSAADDQEVSNSAEQAASSETKGLISDDDASDEEYENANEGPSVDSATNQREKAQ